MTLSDAGCSHAPGLNSETPGRGKNSTWIESRLFGVISSVFNPHTAWNGKVATFYFKECLGTVPESFF
jgi:hypothetical protein